MALLNFPTIYLFLALLKQAEEQTGLKPAYIAVGGSVLASILSLAILGLQFFRLALCTGLTKNTVFEAEITSFFFSIPLFTSLVFCFLPPAYKSFKAIESEGKKDDTQWYPPRHHHRQFALSLPSSFKNVSLMRMPGSLTGLCSPGSLWWRLRLTPFPTGIPLPIDRLLTVWE